MADYVIGDLGTLSYFSQVMHRTNERFSDSGKLSGPGTGRQPIFLREPGNAAQCCVDADAREHVYVKSNDRKGTRAYFYGCMTFHLQRPDSVLESSPGAMEAANEAILGVFESQVLHPEVADTVVRKALDKFRASQKEKKHNRERYHQQIAVVDAESSRLVSAIAAGGNIPSLVQSGNFEPTSEPRGRPS